MAVTETVRIVVTSTGAVTVQKELANIGVAAKQASTGVDFMRSALAGVTAYISAATFIEYADAATRVGNQLKLAGLEGEAFAATQEKLYNAAIRNGQQTEELATLYQKMMSVQEQLGLSGAQAEQTTIDIATAMRMASSSTAAQSGALGQLSQLMGGTMVQAQEFNSLIDGAYPLLMAAAAGSDRWGGSVAKLRNDVKNSNVTVAEFIAAMRAGLPEVAAKAQTMTLTIGQSFVALGQSFQKYLATSQQAISASGFLSRAIQGVAAQMNILVPAAAAVGAAMLASFGVKFMASAIANVVAFTASLARFGVVLVTTVIPALASAAVGAASMGIAFLGALPGIAAAAAAFIAANASILLVVGGAALLTAGLMYLNDQLFNGGKGWKDFQTAAEAAIDGVQVALERIGKLIPGQGIDVTLQGTEVVDKILGAFNTGGSDAAAKLAAALKTQAAPAAKTLATGVTDGAKAAAPIQQSAAEEAATTGAKILDNSFGMGAQQVGTAAEGGADAIGAAIKANGEVMAAKFEGTGRNIYDLFNNWGDSFINSFGVTIGDLLIDFQRAQTEQLAAQAELLRAQADLTNEQYKILRDTGSMPGTAGQNNGGTGGGNDRSTTGSLGGGFGDSGIGSDPGFGKKSSYRPANTNEPKSTGPKTSSGVTGSDGGMSAKGAAAKGGDVNMVNVYDQEGMLKALGTKKGKDAQINFIKANRSEVASALGIA